MIDDEHLSSLLNAAAPVDDHRVARRIWTSVVAFALAAVIAISAFSVRAWGDQTQIDRLQSQSQCRSSLASAVDVSVARALLVVLPNQDGTPRLPTPDQIQQVASGLQAALDARLQTNQLCN